MGVKTYNPDDVSIIVNGRVMTGLADSMVKITRNNDSWTTTVDANGGVTRNYNTDRTGEIEITLKQSSDDNLFISALAAADEAGNAPFAIFVKDNNGSSLYTAETSWVKKWADAEFAKEIGDRVWTFTVAKLIMVNGGNE